ncbi:MAG: phosphoribosylformylglycinamidine cyclo-ligase [Oscillospiraceae bacterium]|jgi:phosphoribosylformylglycinamidine cyclo-ligase|nr:phosphoribosylformylglycinamidine cyclo-ligase [Oscillospiraceae bacterium]
MSEQSSYSKAYAAAGVDITAGYESTALISPMAKSTFIPGVLSGLGGFGGMFAPDLTGITEPVFVSGTDGVGSKLRIAQNLGIHDTIGIDAVAMCVNDIICCGAKPLWFLDYLAVGKNYPEKIADIVSGVADGCRQAGCALIGGETAEHPGIMPADDYDIAGFSVGVVDKKDIILPERVQPGDAVIAVTSSGLHSNGFSLVRKVFSSIALDKYYPELEQTLGEELLTPTRIYVRAILELIAVFGDRIHGISNITGGGFYENIPRILPDTINAVVNTAKIPVPPIFTLLAATGEISPRDMYNTFNMGAGLIIIASADVADSAVKLLHTLGETAYICGEAVTGSGQVEVVL